MKKFISCGVSVFLLISLFNPLSAETISRSFELRCVSSDSAADGASGFKGNSSIFDNDQRLQYLENYAAYARNFFNDPRMDTRVVSLQQAKQRLEKIKPQPLPSVRKRLTGPWKAYGYKPGKKEAGRKRIDYYNSLPGAAVDGGHLVIQPNRTVVLEFDKQDWRARLQWQVLAGPGSVFRFKLGNAALVSHEDIETLSGWVNVKVELDFVSQKYNVYVNDELARDFVEFEAPSKEVSSLEITSGTRLRIDNLWGLGFTKDYADGTGDPHSRDVPFLINTFIDDSFEIAGDVENWTGPDFDDSEWENVNLPYAHGGERYRDESLYLRGKLFVPASERVQINVECLDPSGEIWINGKPVFIAHNRHPISLDITGYVDFDAENLIAVKVDPYKAEETMRHTSADEYIGWFSGRIYLDCTSKVHLEDVFAYTQSIGERAEVKAEIEIKREPAENSSQREVIESDIFTGNLELKMYKWFPVEDSEPVASAQRVLVMPEGKSEKAVVSLQVNDPELWSPESPSLYKLVAEISDESGNILDDRVITTGIRTVSQEGGTFRINGEPAMMNGALLFSMPAPLEILAKWQRSAPGEYILKDLMQLKAMNANTARMSQHHGTWMSINDPRYAEYGDQLGIIFQWGTTSWVRTDSPWMLDFDGLPRYVRQVRNHPSIVMWQPGNHPKFIDFQEGMEWFGKVYDTIRREDRTRLICPTSNLGRFGDLRSDDGSISEKGEAGNTPAVWTAPGLTRGSMEHITGYGADWERLEQWPGAGRFQDEQNWSMGDFRVDYLASGERAFFDFESEESAAQPNWDLRKGKPGYRVMSYEWGYDKGSIGVYLSPDQWLVSQAWQAFSGFEAYKKKRWLDYDGLAWCCLRGGGNTGTYQKPLIDYYDHAKLGFYAVKMAYQPVLACSKNVDLVYGPSDLVPIVIMNLGRAKKVDLKVEVKTFNGEVAFSRTFTEIDLRVGRTFKDLELDISGKLKPGYYAFEYSVIEQ